VPASVPSWEDSTEVTPTWENSSPIDTAPTWEASTPITPDFTPDPVDLAQDELESEDDFEVSPGEEPQLTAIPAEDPLTGVTESLGRAIPGMEQVTGSTEAVAEMLSGFVAEMGGALGAIPYAAMHGLNEGPGGYEDSGLPRPEMLPSEGKSVLDTYVEVQKGAAESFAGKIQYHPKTKSGKEHSKALQTIFSAVRHAEEWMGNAYVDKANSDYMEIKDKIAKGEIDPSTAWGFLQETHAEIIHAIAPVVGGALNISIEGPLLLAGPLRGARKSRVENESIADSLYEHTTKAEQEFIQQTKALAAADRAFLASEKSGVIKQKALEGAERLVTEFKDPEGKWEFVAEAIKNKPLPEGKTWAESVTDLQGALSQARAMSRKLEQDGGLEFSKDYSKFLEQQIKGELEVATVAARMEQRAQLVQWVARTNLEVASRRAQEKGTAVEVELSKVMEEYTYKDSQKLGEFLAEGADLRPPAEVLSTLERKVTDPESGKKFSSRTMEDMSKEQVFFAGNLLPDKMVGDLHPIVKYVVDVYGRANTEASIKLDGALYGIKYEKSNFDIFRGGSWTATKTARAVPNRDGAFTILEALKRKEPKEFERLRNEIFEAEAKSPNKELTAEWFDSKGFSQEYYAGYSALRRNTERVRSYLNDIIDNYNKTRPAGSAELGTIDYLPQYISHSWDGEFRVHIYKGDKHISTVGASSKRQASKLAEEYSKDGFKTDTTRRSVEQSNNEYAVESLKNTLKFLGNKSPEAQAVRAKYADIVGRMGQRAHTMKRKGVEGFLGTAKGSKGNREFFVGQKRFFETAFNYGENMKAQILTEQVLQNSFVAKNYPNAVAQSNKFIRNASGGQGLVSKGVDKMVSMLTNEYVTGDMVRRGIGKANLLTLYNYLFFGNVRFMAMQALQPHLVLPSKMLDLKATKGLKGSVFIADLKSTKDVIKPSAEAAEVIKYGIKNKIIDPNFIEQFPGEATKSRGYESFGAKALDYVSLKGAAAWMEENSRMKAMLWFYHFLKDSGRDHGTAMKESGYLTGKYMTEYHSTARPLIFGETGLGTVGRSMGLFKTWQMNYYGQMYEYVRHASLTNPKSLIPIANTLMTQVSMAGVKGIIGFELADQIAEMLNKHTSLNFRTPSQVVHEAGWMPDILYHGVPTEATGGLVDLSQSLAAPNLAFDEFVAAPGLEFAAGAVSSAAVWADHTLKFGQSLEEDEYRFWKNVAPTSMDGWIERWYTDPGAPVRNPNKKLRGEIKREARDWYPRLLFSAYTAREKKMRDILWQMQRIKENKSMDLDQMVSFGAQIWREKNKGSNVDIPDWAFDYAREQGITDREYWQRVQRRAERQEQSMFDFVTKQGKTKKGREAMDTFNRLNGAGLLDDE